MAGTYAQSDNSKVAIVYTTDDTTTTTLNPKQRTKVQVWISNTLASGTLIPGKPAHWRLRHVLVQAADDSGKIHRKRIVVGSISNTAYSAGTAPTASLDGLTGWAVQGRVGERRGN